MTLPFFAVHPRRRIHSRRCHIVQMKQMISYIGFGRKYSNVEVPTASNQWQLNEDSSPILKLDPVKLPQATILRASLGEAE